MPLMKIPDSVLEDLRCPCDKYLTKAPVTILNGKSLCSDCMDVQDSVSRNSQYEAVASLFLFPCRYKPQGCPKYIHFSRLENHDSECSYRIYECPINLHSTCRCTWKGITSQLCQHYETEHPELYLQADSPKFALNFSDHETYRLIKIEDVLFLLQTKCSSENDKIWFSVVCFKKEDTVRHINYAVKLNSGSNNGRIMKLEDANPLPITKMQMNPSLSLDVNIQTVKEFFKQPDFIECQWDINITEELKLQVKAQQELEEEESYKARNEDIKCVNCGYYMVPPIHRCPKGHKTCVDCKGYYNECKTCQDILVAFTVAEDLEEISKSEQHYCRWIKCRKIFSCNELQEHEQNCPHRIYKCPQCNIWSGVLQQLKEHFSFIHPEVAFSKTLPLCFGLKKSILTYAIAHNEIFKVTVNLSCNSLFANSVTINVWFLGSPQFVNCWDYEVMKNSEKMQTRFAKRIANNYSCNIEVKVENASLEVKPFTFNVAEINLPTTASNTTILAETTGWTPKEVAPFKSAPFGFGASSNLTESFTIPQQGSHVFGSAFVAKQKPKTAAKRSDSNKDATLSEIANSMQGYTLNICKIKH